MYLFTPGRERVRNLLAAMSLLGADVKVVLSSSSGSAEELDSYFGAFGIGSRLLPNNPGVMHSKYLLIDADYELQDVVQRRRIVWTGSHNYTQSALEENDEILIRVAQPSVYGGYLGDWTRLWNLAAAASQTG
jgi:phosphatidylserine/phosphatidylglycerophosphate/cardiolipin synthase-like enzyme